MNFYRLSVIGLTLLCTASITFAQVFDPNDQIVDYNASDPPTTPPLGTPEKWVRTKRVNWNTENFKSYIYNGVAFRLRFPENYSPSEKYPIAIMFHGAGERGTIYDNELNLKHGGSFHDRDIGNGVFPGFALFPQNTDGYWSDAHLGAIHYLLKEELFDIGVDPNRVVIHGLSAGGGAVWRYMYLYPKDIAAALPMSAASYLSAADVDIYKYVPIWLSQGGKDNNPTPFTSGYLRDTLASVGGNIRYTLYHNKGHNVWYDHYAESDFWPYILRANRTNPVVLTGELTTVSSSTYRDVIEFLTKTEICPGDPIQVTMGLAAGFEAYEWRRNGSIIPGATSNEYVASEFGTYDVRFMENNVWSEWSAEPVIIKEKDATDTPDISVSGLASRVLPAPDGNTTVPLELPEGFVEYEWRLEGTTEVLSTNRIFYASAAGNYVASVTEQFGCSSNESIPFKVIDANGTMAPSELSTFVGFADSKTSIQLQWTVGTSNFPSTGYEIYRSDVSGGTYQLIGIADGSSSSFTDINLNADTYYYYIIRPINEFGAANISTEISVKTEVDYTPPTAPLNLKISRTGSNSVSLSWESSMDDVGVYKYDIYKDGVKSIVTEATSATLFNLIKGQHYQFSVKARDLAGNTSAFSNVVIGVALPSGINYQFYQKDWSEDYLVDLTTKTPLDEGNIPNFDIGVRQFDTYYAFLFSGEIKIPFAGSYTFETISDDGSKLYIGAYDESDLVVNNDGNHGMRRVEGTVVFDEPGFYPIHVAFYQEGGGQGLEVRWKNTAHGVTSSEIIPDEYFEAEVNLPGEPPISPSELTAVSISYDQIDLGWTDSSENENGFQIFRSESIEGPYTPIALTGENINSYSDNGVSPSTTYYYQIISIGDFGPSGIVTYPISQLGDVNNGVAALDNATGTGYIMYSERNVFTRFSNNKPNNSNSDHLIAVKYFSGQWHYDNNLNYYPLSLEEGDLLIAEVDFSNDQITSLEGINSTIQGIEAGYASGDLTFYADRWGSNNNDGEFRIEGTVINRNVDVAIATTNNLPNPPVRPTNFTYESITNNEVNLTWTGVNNADFYQLLRSPDGTSYLPIADIEHTTESGYNFTDVNVNPHTNYFYRLVAINAGGESIPSDISVSTVNSIPTLSDLPSNLVIGFDATYNLQLFADDDDGDILEITASNLPSFALLSDYGDGSGLLQFITTESDLGSYKNIVIEVSDAFGGVDQHILSIEVNSNSLPELSEVSSLTVSEGEVSAFQIVATDEEGVDNLTWEYNLPDFVSYTLNLGGILDVEVSPDYIDHGIYAASVSVEDQDGASTTIEFDIEVIDVDPNTNVLVNFAYTTQASSPWNNISTLGTHQLLTTSGEQKGITLEFITNAWSAYQDGAQTGNDSGVFPDDVLKDYYYFGIFGAPNTVQFKVTGLDPNTAYDFSFLASSVWSGAANNGSTVFTIDGVSETLAVQGNTQNTADFDGIYSAANGEVVVTMAKAANTPVGYINGFSINTSYGLDQVPAAPKDLTAVMEESSVLLSWSDVPFNESGFRIYRSDDGVNYSQIGEVDRDVESFRDSNVIAGMEYSYQVNAFNSTGNSDYTKVVTFTIPNIVPTMEIIGSISIFINQTTTLSIIATDSPDDVVTVSVSSLPAFGTFSTTEDGGEIVLSPLPGDEGSYIFTVSAEDNKGGLIDQDVEVSVSEENLYSISVNFSQTSNQGGHWNNTSKAPSNGDTFSNLINDSGANTPVSLSLLTSFGGVYNATPNTGDNSGVVPDNVLREYYWWGIFNAPNEVRMKVSGLDINNKYSFKFVGSSTFDLVGITDNGETVYTIGNKSVSVYVQGNTKTAGLLSDVTADLNGEVVISMTKGNGASAGYINALIIEAYPGDEDVFNPSDLTASGTSRSTINLNWNDNSFNEESFEVYRSTSRNGTFSLVSTVGADVTTFQDSGLNGGQLYFYKVRAKFGENDYSSYTNIVSSGTVAFTVYVNINGDATYNASVPWNNLGYEGSTGTVFTGFKNQDGNPTGIALEVINGMQGSNNWGTTTGDDSGVYPDDVMQSFFFSDALEEPGRYILRGLDVGYQYNLDFFGSIQTIYHVGTKFIVGDKFVSTYQTNNVAEVVGIDGIVPNFNGEIEFTVQEESWSRWAIFNALVIEAYPVEQSDQQARSAEQANDIIGDYVVSFGEDGESEIEVSIYPNPIKDEINIFIGDSEEENIDITVYDLNGNAVFNESYDLVGASTLKIVKGINELSSGIYILSVTAGPERRVKRIIKQ